MRGPKYLLLGLIVLTGVLWCQSKDLTLEDLYIDLILYPQSVAGVNWLGDGTGFLFQYEDTSRGAIQKFDFQSRQVSEFYPDSILYGDVLSAIDDFRINSAGTLLLVCVNQQPIWRHSREGNYYLIDLASGEINPVADGKGLRNVKFSPDGKFLAYVYANNLYCCNISAGKTRRLTKDGSENIINGQFGWVYEEEFGSADGYRWSPDSKKIAFWREDQTGVPRFKLIDEMTTYPQITEVAYPKAGETNPTVKIGVVDVKKGRPKWMEIYPGYDIYIPRITWAGNSDELAILRLNRPQNKMDILLADVKTGNSRLLLTETDPCWLDVTDDWHFLSNGSFLWTSERSGYRHIYRYDRTGELTATLTGGAWEVNEILAVDEEAGVLYFTGKYDSVLEDHLYSVSLAGGAVNRLSSAGGSHRFEVEPSGNYFIDTFSSLTTPPQVRLIDNAGEIRAVLIGNTAPGSDEYSFTYPELVEVPTSDGQTVLNGMLCLPPDFDPARKYPVIIFGYGGPGSQRVLNQWGGHYYYFHQIMAREGFISFSIDNRGTGGRGKEFEHLAYGDLGKWLVIDQIEGVKYLRSLPYVDSENIGIWGHSGGGYMTAMCLTKGSEYFQVGIARAPVTDFHLYDTIWTERYMGLPEDNSAGYDSASVFTYADHLQGKLLLIHGTGDDNVHPQNSLQLADHFVKNGKLVDMYFYANKNHGIRGPFTSYNLHKRMKEYFIEHLK